MFFSPRHWFFLAAILSQYLALTVSATQPAGIPTSLAKSHRPNILIVAPHPDDEALGCGGVIQQTLQKGGRITVIVVSNGELYFNAAALFSHISKDSLDVKDFYKLAIQRQKESCEAMRILGLSEENIIFLGYPNHYLDSIFLRTGSTPLWSPELQTDHTMEALFKTYHLRMHGVQAPFNHTSVVSDLREIIQNLSPEEIYVTDSADSHRDHCATNKFVREALTRTKCHATVRSYIVHSGSARMWPGRTDSLHSNSFVQARERDTLYPLGLSWPPPVRIPLTKAETAKKLSAIECYKSQLAVPGDSEYLKSFARSEEVFWLPQ